MAISIGSGLLAATMLLGQTPDVPTPVPGSTTPSRTIIYNSDTTVTNTQPQPAKGPIASWFSREDRPILSRIQSWFGVRKEQKDTRDATEPPLLQGYSPAPRNMTPIDSTAPKNPGANDFPRKMPNTSTQNPASTDAPPRLDGPPRIDVPAPPQPKDKAPAKDLSMTIDPTGRTIQQASLQMSASSAKSPILPRLANKIGRDEHFEWITGQLEIENGAYVIYYATPETVDPHHGRLVLQPQKVDMSKFHRTDLVCVRGELVQRVGMTATYRTSDVQVIDHAK